MCYICINTPRLPLNDAYCRGFFQFHLTGESGSMCCCLSFAIRATVARRFLFAADKKATRCSSSRILSSLEVSSLRSFTCPLHELLIPQLPLFLQFRLHRVEAFPHLRVCDIQLRELTAQLQVLAVQLRVLGV
jgi:hypothetical protein